MRKKDWVRAGLRLDDAGQYVARGQSTSRLLDAEIEILKSATEQLESLSRAAHKLISLPVEKDLSGPNQQLLDRLISDVMAIEVRIQQRIVEGDRGEETA